MYPSLADAYTLDDYSGWRERRQERRAARRARRAGRRGQRFGRAEGGGRKARLLTKSALIGLRRGGGLPGGFGKGRRRRVALRHARRYGAEGADPRSAAIRALSDIGVSKAAATAAVDAALARFSGDTGFLGDLGRPLYQRANVSHCYSYAGFGAADAVDDVNEALQEASYKRLVPRAAVGALVGIVAGTVAGHLLRAKSPETKNLAKLGALAGVLIPLSAAYRSSPKA